MKTKGLILIGVIILILCVGIGAYTLASSAPEYQNITMNEVTFEVPESNVTVTSQGEHFNTYNDTDKGIAIFVFDSQDSSLDDAGDMISYAAIKDTFQADSQLQQENGIEYNYSETLDVYTYLTNYTHKNVFIVTKNKEDLLHIIPSISVDEEIVEINETNNTTIDEKTSHTTTSDKKKTSQDSDIVSESIEENYQEDDGSTFREVKYKDGNFRQYDTRSGELIGSSYDSDQKKLKDKYGI